MTRKERRRTFPCENVESRFYHSRPSPYHTAYTVGLYHSSLDFTTAVTFALLSSSLLFASPRCADRSLVGAHRRSSSLITPCRPWKRSRVYGKDPLFAVWKAGAAVENSCLPQSRRQRCLGVVGLSVKREKNLFQRGRGGRGSSEAYLIKANDPGTRPVQVLRLFLSLAAFTF